jgi:hypothetical protein
MLDIFIFTVNLQEFIMKNVQKYLMLALIIYITIAKLAHAGDENSRRYTYGGDVVDRYDTHGYAIRPGQNPNRATTTYRKDRRKYNNYATKQSDPNTNNGRSMSSAMSTPSPESWQSGAGIR